MLAGGGKIAEHMPPWYSPDVNSADSMISALQALAAQWKEQ